MTDAPPPRRLALLIDAENIAPDFMRQVLPQVLKLGRPIIQYAYGDFSEPCLKPWVTFLRENIIEARQVTPALSGKNAADIALVVDAMDLALRGKCDAVCVVSSDRDFIALTLYLKREGIDVYGFGKPLADKKYRQSCAKFFQLKEAGAEAKPAKSAPLPACVATKMPVLTAAPNWPLIFEEIVKLAGKDGWLSLQALGHALGPKGIRFKDYGGASWAKVFNRDPRFEVRREKSGSSVRLAASPIAA